jgi:universal stress protein E
VAIGYPEHDDQWALLKAAAVAARCGARLTLLHTFSLPYPLVGSSYRSTSEMVHEASAARRARLAALVEHLGIGAEVDYAVEWDVPVSGAIVRHVLREKPDLLVADSHRHGRLGRLFLNNTDWELIRSVPCPLWFVKSPGLPKRPKMMAAVDPVHVDAVHSGLDGAILRLAKRLRRALGAALTVAHVLEPSPEDDKVPRSRGAWSGGRRPHSLQEARARHAVLRLARRHGMPSAKRAFGRGEPSVALKRLARATGTDLVIMGAVSRRAQQRAFIGTTAERVIDQLRCDILIVKAPAFATDVSAKRALHL